MGLLAQEALAAEMSHTDMRQTDSQNEDDGIVVSGNNSRGYKMSYEKLVPSLIKAVQELSAKVEALENA